MNSLPDGLADALGRVVADVRQEFRKEVERTGTESRLIIAELRADVLALKAELKSVADRELARIPEAIANLKDGAPGRDGLDGKDGVDGKDGINGIEGAAGKDGTNGLDGRDGVDGAAGRDGVDGADGSPGLNGKDADPDLILKMVTESVGTIPIPKDGRDGKDADPELIAGLVAKAVGALPVAKDGLPGKDGADGVPGRDGRDGLAGVQGEKGIDGVNGKDGRDGMDGLGFDDLTVEHDGERTVTLKFVKGERVESFPVTFPVPIYRGVYKSGTKYQKGDSVTFAGSTHIAETDTEDKPESGKGWRLAVKHGRDGKDGRNGERGPQGSPGKGGGT